MNAGYYIGKWVEGLLKKNSQAGVIKIIAAYTGNTIAKNIVTSIIAKKSATAVAAAAGAKLGILSGPVGVFLAGLAGAV